MIEFERRTANDRLISSEHLRNNAVVRTLHNRYKIDVCGASEKHTVSADTSIEEIRVTHRAIDVSVHSFCSSTFHGALWVTARP